MMRSSDWHAVQIARRLGLAAIAIACAGGLALHDRPVAHAASFSVTTTADSGPGSLRQAILDSNATLPGPNAITFSIPSGGIQTIAPLTALPSVNVPVTIDGTTQSGYSGTPLIALNGASAGPASDGLDISTTDTVVSGLAIGAFSRSGIYIEGTPGPVEIVGNFIGTDATGTAARGNISAGVLLDDFALNVTIGGTLAGQRNVISGNGNGVVIDANVTDGTNGNVVEGNYIGTDPTGTVALGNTGDGVQLVNGSASTSNTIGGTAAGAGNVISANGGSGISLAGSAMNDTVRGDLIGTNAAGTGALGNAVAGVRLDVAGPGNIIGGTAVGARNVIAGNAEGVELDGASGNQITGNYIGTDISGTVPLKNTDMGVVALSGALASVPSGNIVGGTLPGAGNVISANGASGVGLFKATNNVVEGNLIGTNAAGTGALGNAVAGVQLAGGASSNVIGGTVPGARNVISGNAEGVELDGASGNQITGNYIGTDVSGTLPLKNTDMGVVALSGALASVPSGNAVGGTLPGAGNVIANNSSYGVFLGSGNGNAVLSNSIFQNGLGGFYLGAGANNDQPAPALTDASTDGSATTVAGVLTAAPLRTYRIEYFSNAACGPGTAQGRSFIGVAGITTDGAGTAVLNNTFPISVGAAQIVTATATDSNGDTSVFSNCQTVRGPAAVGGIAEVPDASMLTGAARRHGSGRLQNWEMGAALGAVALGILICAGVRTRRR